MAQNLSRKILASHLAKPSDLKPGEEIYLKVDQTLTHDINAVMTYLAFEAIGLDRTQVETSVSYLDHNLLYLDYKTPDDHIYLQSAAKKFGVYVSRPGNGICHAVQAARFGAPGKLSMGGDSHTPHGGSMGMLCIGVGGMDITTAMTGVPMRLKMPQIIRVNLTGRLSPGCSAKEVILEMLRRSTVKTSEMASATRKSSIFAFTLSLAAVATTFKSSSTASSTPVFVTTPPKYLLHIEIVRFTRFPNILARSEFNRSTTNSQVMIPSLSKGISWSTK